MSSMPQGGLGGRQPPQLGERADVANIAYIVNIAWPAAPQLGERIDVEVEIAGLWDA